MGQGGDGQGMVAAQPSMTLAPPRLTKKDSFLVGGGSKSRLVPKGEIQKLAQNAKPAPSPEQLGARKGGKNALKTPHHALQDVLSYPVQPFTLDDVHQPEQGPSRRPRVFIKRPNGRRKIARYGEDMFMRARVHLEQPLLVVRQEQSKDVVISAIQALDWLGALGEDSSQNGESLQIVPAGSFSYRRSIMGATVRLLMQLHTFANPAKLVCQKQYPPVRVACVVIPRVVYKGEQHLVITQRVTKHHGTYNNMYCFPGGHVEAGETLEEGALRECYEETGLKISPGTMRLRCCWQEVLPPKQLQFLMLVYSGDVLSEHNANGEFSWDDVSLQKEEVATLAVLPERIWHDVATRADVQDRVEALVADPETSGFRRDTVAANDITGYNAGFGHGIGSGHRYALLQFLDPFDKHVFGEDRHPGARTTSEKTAASQQVSQQPADEVLQSADGQEAGSIEVAKTTMPPSTRKSTQRKSWRESLGRVLRRGADVLDPVSEPIPGADAKPRPGSPQVVEMSPRMFESPGLGAESAVEVEVGADFRL